MLISLTRYAILAAALISSVAADFHLMLGDYKNLDRFEYFSCPSNYYKAKCWCGADRRSSTAYVNAHQKVTLNNVCGVKAIDFWYRQGDKWEAYIPNADGHVVATCYPNGRRSVGRACNLGLSTQYTVYDGWVCYTPICGYA